VDGILPPMTMMTMTFELQGRLKPEQFRALGEFANTYGLHKFHYDQKTNHLTVDYDASRLREAVVEHVLRQARIPVLRRLEPAA
jgi:sulfite reductase beta subunit-like hemoprotein